MGRRAGGEAIGGDALATPALTLAPGGPPMGLVVVAALLLWLPGAALARLCLRPPRYDGLDWLLAGPALGVAVLALLTLWATVLGVPLGPVTAWALLALVAGALFLPAPTRRAEPLGRRPCPRRGGLALGYLAVLVLGLSARLWSTHDVVPALGADTYHHALIARLLVERGGVPDAYAPYAPIGSFAYHFGFHSLVAWLHWWTGAELGVLLPLAGHLVNTAVAWSAAWWTRRLLGDEWMALLVAWLTALLAVFPAYFVNWGRFTQTTGLLLLPVAAALWADAGRALTTSRPGARQVPPLVLTAVASAGLFLAHYRLAAMLPLLLVVGGVAAAARWLGQGARPAARPLCWTALWLTGVCVAAGLLILPWLARLAGALGLGLGEQPGAYGTGYYALERLGSAPWQPANLVLGPLAAVGALLAWRRRATGLLALGVWGAAQLALANPHWWPRAVAFAGRVDLITVVTTLWWPLAVAAGYALAVTGRTAWRRWPRLAPLAAGLVLAGGSAFGVWQLRALLVPDNSLLTEADLAAIVWIRANTPPGARFAASAVLVPWAADYAVGIDGGYWLPLLAGRPTTLLPMLYPAERGTAPRAIAEMVAVARALRDAPGAPETAQLLRALGVAYIYHSGRAPAPSIAPALSSPDYAVAYAHDSVRVLAVRPEAGSASEAERVARGAGARTP